MDLNYINAVLLEGTLSFETGEPVITTEDGVRHNLKEVLEGFEDDEVRFTMASLTDLATLAEILGTKRLF